MIWLCAFISGVLLVLVWLVNYWGKTTFAAYEQSKAKTDKLRADFIEYKQTLRDEIAEYGRAYDKQIRIVSEARKLELDEALEAVARDSKRVFGELEVLTTRQRSLEKSIIRSERTINLNIIPPTGKGRGSLLKQAGLTT